MRLRAGVGVGTKSANMKKNGRKKIEKNDIKLFKLKIKSSLYLLKLKDTDIY